MLKRISMMIPIQSIQVEFASQKMSSAKVALHLKEKYLSLKRLLRGQGREQKNDHVELTTRMVGNHPGSNICVDSSIEVGSGSNMSFMDLLTTCETPLMGSSQVCTN